MLTDEEFRLFRNLIYERSGMYFKESKKGFVEHRIAGRMKATNAATPYWYYRYVTELRTTEFLALLDVLSVNETSFFRNGPQFELFASLVLPELERRKKRDILPRLRIWSAGCSTGEEPYSIAMSVLDALKNASGWDIRVLASDLSLKALEAAHRGVYAASKTEETVPPALLERHFDRTGDGYRVKDAVRRLVVFDYHNLKNDNDLTGLDVIFCRNVMIYFDDAEQRRVAEKFYRMLDPGGYLLLGHAESLHGWNTGFRFIHKDKGTAYQKPEREAP